MLLTCQTPAVTEIASEQLRLEFDPRFGIAKVQIWGGDYRPVAKALGAELPDAQRAILDNSSAVEIAWLAPDEWLLFGAEPDVARAADQARAALSKSTALVTDLTHARAAFRLIGAKARDALAAHCPLDFSDAAFPVGAVARSLLGETHMFVGRRADEDRQPSFRLIVDQTMAQYASRLLARTGPHIL